MGGCEAGEFFRKVKDLLTFWRNAPRQGNKQATDILALCANIKEEIWEQGGRDEAR